MKLALGVEYLGTHFVGWERQKQGRTVQGAVEQALSIVADHPVRVICAGRTDSGVHALGQVIHFETETERSITAWLKGSNVNLPADVALTWVRQVPASFHARFSALSRHYRYIIYNQAVRPALMDGRASWVYKPLNLDWMQQAAAYLLGEHDFSTYRAAACQAKSPVRTMHRLDIQRHGQVITIDVVANAFLHHMVRNIAGVLINIGKGDRPVHWAEEILHYRDRTRGGVTAPPDGLYLVEVEYPAKFRLPGVQPLTAVW